MKDTSFDFLKLFEKMKTEMFLTFLFLVLFIFDRKSAIDFVRMLIVFILSSYIMKNHFSHLIIRLSNRGNGRIYEYTFVAIFTFFIFIEIEFLLNRLYIYAFLTFVSLLVFVGIALCFVAGGKSYQATESEK